jgi:hypothetical protein
VLAADPGTGVMRHADAGYPEALEAARDGGLDLPSIPGGRSAAGGGSSPPSGTSGQAAGL